MKKIFLTILNVFIIGGIIILSADAYKKGENRINNGTFEIDKVGELPKDWELRTGG